MKADPNRRVNVYFNLHKKVWSVRQGGKVISHTNLIALRNVRFLVGKAGRQKVLREKRKNVHAYASGYIVKESDVFPSSIPDDCCFVSYNPYENETFVRKDDGRPCLTADRVLMEVKDSKVSVEAVWI